jgi:hypothetical protein
MIFLFFKKSGPTYKKKIRCTCPSVRAKSGPTILNLLNSFKKKKTA